MSTGASTTTVSEAITISRSNCVQLTGRSWSWITRFARAHDVPRWHVQGATMIPAAELRRALQREAARIAPETIADEVGRLQARMRERRARRRPE